MVFLVPEKLKFSLCQAMVIIFYFILLIVLKGINLLFYLVLGKTFSFVYVISHF